MYINNYILIIIGIITIIIITINRDDFGNSFNFDKNIEKLNE